ncbi:uncharacterized protein BXZ73DRAFT_90162 [Epithele typhae]|uniref:uncharacterized protein n=1 Tax=Epithele typhae TaxID=378194 RepID=UPI002007FDD8|nr:uncharacterized protein BXZ73DRAFT_90162 [Epithele typhae]KAH9931075.1 hypothetical protein BXZ73DRAFT_90162 [Epithele typhae]
MPAATSADRPLAPAMHALALPLPPIAQHPSLPSSSSNSESSTPVPSASAQDPKKKPAAKRKRTAGSAADHGDAGSGPRSRDGPKKKKANRACFHCQKAHLTCDDTRPCQRCVKRGMADNCTEGHRKKAKYLLDEEEIAAIRPPEGMYPVYTSAPPYGVPAEAANLEYSVLSAILGAGSPESGSSGSPAAGQAPAPVAAQPYVPPPDSGLSAATWPAEALQGQYSSPTTAQPEAAAYPGAPGYGPSDTTPGTVPSEFITPNVTGYQAAYPTVALGQPGPSQFTEYSPDRSQVSSQAVPGPSSYRSPTQSFLVRPRRTTMSSPTAARGWLSPSLSTANTPDHAIQSVYRNVTKGYDYTEGYHFLMKHMSRRFEKNDILRIVRALAIVRPSFIALQMPMTEEDDVFVEKCFQRSLIELDKLVSMSGTPTVAWRRTGEICLVGPEFCMLSGWDREELVGKRKYIYELFENQSVVEYWENFANHAFENTTQSWCTCACTFCFSIRRDIMDLPSLVIGQWLPLL